MTDSEGLFVRDYMDDDRDRVLDVLADSFAGFPPIDVVAGTDEAARERRRRLFEFELSSTARHQLIVAGSGIDISGVLSYTDAPQCSAMSPRLLLSFIRLAGPRLLSTMNMYRKVDRLHPRAAHRHLVSIGIDPGRQGGGIGGALTTEYARRCDRDGIDGYLETIRWVDPARPSHERFYSRYGFMIKDELDVADDWTGLTMWRSRQAAAPTT